MKSVLVTGAYGGMGRATVALLKEQGFQVFALDRTVEAPEERVIPLEADVTSEESVAAVRRELLENDALSVIAALRQMGLSKQEAIALIETYWR